MAERSRGEQIRPDDDVGDAGFVFEREEDESFGGARALPGDDRAGDAHAPPVPAARQIDRAQDAAQRQLHAPQRHRMRTDRQARCPRNPTISRSDARHRLQRRLAVRSRCDPGERLG